MFDITSMLGNSGSKSNNSGLMGTMDLANLAAIKNGSYGKLVKSYYNGTTKSVDEAKVTSLNSKNSEKSNKLKEEANNSEVTRIKKEADQLKASAEALDNDELWKKTDGKLDMTKVTSAVKSFADNYNKVIDQAGKVSSKEVSQDATNMVQLSITYGKVLGRVGINIGEDGKLSVDEDKLKKADEASLKSLFDGFGTYGSQIADKASAITRDADFSSAIYGSDATTSSTLSSLYNQLI